MPLTPKRSDESFTEMVQVVLPNDANPLGYILGGTVMHLIDIAGAIACHRHSRSLLVTTIGTESRVTKLPSSKRAIPPSRCRPKLTSEGFQTTSPRWSAKRPSGLPSSV